MPAVNAVAGAAPSEGRRAGATLAATILGVVFGIAGIGWFYLAHIMPWQGWDSPFGEMIQSLHGVAAIGFAALSFASIGVAITPRSRPLCSATAFFVAVLIAACAAGLYMIGTINMLPISALGTPYAVDAAFIVVCGIIGQLLK